MTYKNRHDQLHKNNRHNSKGHNKPNYRPKHIGQEYEEVNRNFRKSKIKKAVAGAAVGSAVLFGGAMLMNKFVDSPEKKAEKLEEKILNNMENLTTSDDIVVLNPGVKVRETPMRYVFDSETGRKNRSVDNVAFEVGENENVVINRALIFEDDEGQQWQGFMIKQQDEESAELRWVNVTALSEQSNEDGQSPIRIIPANTSDTFLEPMIIKNKEGNVTAVSDPEGSLSFATGQIVPSNETNSLVDKLLGNK